MSIQDTGEWLFKLPAYCDILKISIPILLSYPIKLVLTYFLVHNIIVLIYLSNRFINQTMYNIMSVSNYTPGIFGLSVLLTTVLLCPLQHDSLNQCKQLYSRLK